MPYPGKLSHPQRLEVCAWLALGNSPSQTVTLCRERFGVSVSWENLHQNYLQNPRWQKLIDRIRREFEDRITDIPIAHKAVRLRRLEQAYQKAMTPEAGSVAQTGTRKGSGQIQRPDLRAALATLRDARIEMEGHGAETKPNKMPGQIQTFVDAAKYVCQRRQGER